MLEDFNKKIRFKAPFLVFKLLKLINIIRDTFLYATKTPIFY